MLDYYTYTEMSIIFSCEVYANMAKAYTLTFITLQGNVSISV